MVSTTAPSPQPHSNTTPRRAAPLPAPQATIAADAATITELRSRLQALESRLSDEVAARQELFGRHKALEADLKLATERHAALAASQSEAESRTRAATSKMQLLEDELEASKKALQVGLGRWGAGMPCTLGSRTTRVCHSGHVLTAAGMLAASALRLRRRRSARSGSAPPR